MNAKKMMKTMNEIITCERKDSLKELAIKMQENNSTFVAILNSNGNFLGMITQSNICSFIGNNIDFENSKVEDYMTSLVAYVGKDASRLFVIEIMLTKKVHHIIVRSKDFRMVGLITSMDIVNSYRIKENSCIFLYNLHSIPLDKVDEFLKKCLDILEAHKQRNEKQFQII